MHYSASLTLFLMPFIASAQVIQWEPHPDEGDKFEVTGYKLHFEKIESESDCSQGAPSKYSINVDKSYSYDIGTDETFHLDSWYRFTIVAYNKTREAKEGPSACVFIDGEVEPKSPEKITKETKKKGKVKLYESVNKFSFGSIYVPASFGSPSAPGVEPRPQVNKGREHSHGRVSSLPRRSSDHGRKDDRAWVARPGRVTGRASHILPTNSDTGSSRGKNIQAKTNSLPSSELSGLRVSAVSGGSSANHSHGPQEPPNHTDNSVAFIWGVLLLLIIIGVIGFIIKPTDAE